MQTAQKLASIFGWSLSEACRVYNIVCLARPQPGPPAAPRCTCSDHHYSAPLATALMRFLHLHSMDDVDPFFAQLLLAAEDVHGHMVMNDTDSWQMTCMFAGRFCAWRPWG